MLQNTDTDSQIRLTMEGGEFLMIGLEKWAKAFNKSRIVRSFTLLSLAFIGILILWILQPETCPQWFGALQIRYWLTYNILKYLSALRVEGINFTNNNKSNK